MSKLGAAFKAFFAVLKGVPDVKSIKAPKTEEKKPERSEALTLLAALQREARLVDFLMEDLTACSNEQIGAAVRDIQRDSRATLERMFKLGPLRKEAEGTEINVPAGYDPDTIRLSGQVSGEGPYKGELVHPGWTARKCDLPKWNGKDLQVVAAAEVETK